MSKKAFDDVLRSANMTYSNVTNNVSNVTRANARYLTSLELDDFFELSYAIFCHTIKKFSTKTGTKFYQKIEKKSISSTFSCQKNHRNWLNFWIIIVFHTFRFA